MADILTVRGAREHNLQGVDIDLPGDKMIVFTGISGSGKSSLAFDTIFAEGQGPSCLRSVAICCESGTPSTRGCRARSTCTEEGWQLEEPASRNGNAPA